jgi:CheY-like chemotaxis protein
MARIIVVDDDDTFRDSLVAMLSGAGHEPVAAVNGLEGVRLCLAGPADLILTDIQMPYGGLPIIRALRREFPRLAIIAMSGGSKAHLAIAGGVGANRILAKPFTPDQLEEAIAGVLGTTP